MKYKVDPTVVIEQFGGDRELVAKYLNYFGVEINIKTIQKWKERETLPTSRYLELMELADYYKIEINPFIAQRSKMPKRSKSNGK